MGGNLQVMPASNLITSLTSSNRSCTYYKMTGPLINNASSTKTMKQILQLTGKSVKAIPEEKNLHIILMCGSRKYPFPPPHGRLFDLHPPPHLPGFSVPGGSLMTPPPPRNFQNF